MVVVVECVCVCVCVCMIKESQGGKEQEFGMSRCILLYIEWINNKVLLSSTGNYIQYPEINHNGKEYKKGCITESLCCTQSD